jgi:uncharacterized radical SAM superfamily protein
MVTMSKTIKTLDDIEFADCYCRGCAATAECDALREFVESAQIIHFKHNGKNMVIYKDGDTFTLYHGGGDSKGHTHVWDAFKALKETNDE